MMTLQSTPSSFSFSSGGGSTLNSICFLPYDNELVANEQHQQQRKKEQQVIDLTDMFEKSVTLLRPQCQSQQQPEDASSSSPRQEKVRFLLFCKVLIRILERKDFDASIQAREIIRDCTDRHHRQEVGYANCDLTECVRSRLLDTSVVSSTYWDQAEASLQEFVLNSGRGEGAGTSAATGGGASAAAGAVAAGELDKLAQSRKRQQQHRALRQKHHRRQKCMSEFISLQVVAAAATASAAAAAEDH